MGDVGGVILASECVCAHDLRTVSVARGAFEEGTEDVPRRAILTAPVLLPRILRSHCCG